MEKINFQNSRKYDFKNKSDKLEKIKQHIISKTGYEPKSIRIVKDSVVVEAQNNYEAVEIRLKLGSYLEKNNIRVGWVIN